MLKFILGFSLVFILLSEADSYDSKIWDNWYFGRRAGLSFDTPDKIPVPLNNGRLNTLEGCASISDTNGNLQFYTNGVTVYNKNHEIMLNGVNLNGHNSSTQSALIVKRPGTDNIYYIFTTDKGPYDGPSQHEHSFSIVDMDMENGLGAVTIKNMILHKPVVEKLTAVQHANGQDFWIIAHGMNNNNFIITLLTSGGIISTNTFEIGPTYFPFPASPEYSLGQLKANPEGDMLATVVYGANNLELYKFDNRNGTITGYLGIPVEEPVSALYGVEFSQNNKFVYINNLFGRIYQYDVSDWDPLKIYSSMKLVYDSLDYSYQEFGQMQLAPNGRIYMAISYDTLISVIDKPNVPSPYCRFDKKGQSLNGSMSTFGLPNNVVTGVYYSVDIYGRDLCLGKGDSLELFSIVYPEDNKYVYEWKGPNGFTSSLPNPKIPNAGIEAAGKYVCNVSINGKFFKSDSTIVGVYEYPVAEIISPITICPPEIVKLSSKYNSPEYIYKWSDGSNDSEILINSPGRYSLVITNPAGCKSDSVFTDIKYADNLSIDFEENSVLCKGQTIEISLAKDIYTPLRDYKINWSTGDSTLSIKVNKSGYYSVTVTRSGGCKGTDSILVTELEFPKIELNYKDTLTVCEGQDVIIEPKEVNGAWTYTWSDGFMSINRKIINSGLYTLRASNKGYCEDSAWVYVKFIEIPKVDISHNNQLSLCYGDSVILRSTHIDDDFSYLWSNGSEIPQIVVKESGIYRLKISNSAGCSDSAEIEVFVSPPVELEINADKKYLCLNDSLTLECNSRYATYKWSTGDTTDYIRVHKAGNYKLMVTNQYGCSDTAEIEIKDINITAQFSKSDILIDSICSGEISTESLEIIYNSDQGIEISDYNYQGDNFQFDLLQNIEQISDGTYLHNITFSNGNNKPGIYRGEILVTIEKPCYNQFAIPVYVKVYSEFTFSAPEIIAQAGDKICIKIDVSAGCANSDNHNYSPEFNVDMVPEHFFPESVKGGSLIENIYAPNLRTIKLKMDEQTFPKGVIRSLEICGKALVGKKETSPIIIGNVLWDNDYINNTFFDGSLTIEGCVQDISALQTFRPISITVNPNPVTSNAEIVINSQEIGKHFVEIYSVDGRLIISYELNDFKLMNLQSIQINTFDFRQGLYQIVVRSPWNVLTEKLIIIKN